MKHSNLALVEREVYVLSKPSESLPKQIIYIEGRGYLTVLYSTADLDGIPKLEREWFVKPDADEIYKKAVESYANCKMNVDHADYIFGFKAGHNANKAEFTRGEMEQAMHDAKEYPNKINPEITFSDFVKSYLDRIRPLSLPKSITLNDDNELVEIIW